MGRSRLHVPVLFCGAYVILFGIVVFYDEIILGFVRGGLRK